jgi:hypothetical protein
MIKALTTWDIIEIMKNIPTIVVILSLIFGALSCSADSLKVYNYTSEHYGIKITLPGGWAAAEDGNLGIMHEKGLVAFNSWGQKDYWARAKTTYSSDGSPSSVESSPYIVAAQIPPGGAYVALVEISGPPPSSDNLPPEHNRDDLSGLFQAHDWRQDGSGSVYYKNFYKAGSDLILVVACSQNATDKTVAQINDLLKSWRFVNFSPDYTEKF